MYPDQGANWRKSSHSSGQGGNCVELLSTLDALRDSKNPNGPMLKTELSEFITMVKADRFDR
jgi:hypothetical protein